MFCVITPVLSRQVDSNDGLDCLAVQEIESLQAELETLSASVVKRMLLIQSELNILNATPMDKGKEKAVGTPINATATMSVSLALFFISTIFISEYIFVKMSFKLLCQYYYNYFFK